MKFCVQFEWHAVGEISVQEERLRFPDVPQAPGVYRFKLMGLAEERYYIGEASLLRRRFQHYRTPGPSQPTNLRLRGLLVELLSRGGRCEVEIITGITLNIDDQLFQADLGYRPSRLIVENAALIAARQTGLVVENL